ncbi:MAG: PEP-CTERM sorting domain-containing protein [Verrucomicrobiota bacterium]
MKTIATIALLAASVITSHAAIVITAAEVGGNVVISGSGSIDLAGAAPGGPTILGDDALIIPNGAAVGYDALGGGTTLYDSYIAISPGPFGTGGATTTPIVSGDPFFVAGGLIGLPPGYVSNAPISFSSTYVGTTFAGLGITTPVASVWALPSDTVTLTVGSVPEPSTYIAGAGLLGLGTMVWLRRRKLKQST